MYVIIVYDIKVERVNKVKSFLRQYLFWIQNSVFEGEISVVQLTKMKQELEPYINSRLDSVVIFKSRQQKWLDKELWGKQDDLTDFIL